ncbi:papain cysteine protease family protein [Tribonema minus]|uniref:Papain cysteine protease family protein n=1 Tax=Tribonema minus TaxID=303371 RepID=A0A835ZJV4_9STRA|nr:papain cysteine protease family protein [Tribonema minus]
MLVKPSPEDTRDYKFKAKTTYSNLPTSVDLTLLLPPALDQGALGSCAANAGSVALRFLYKKQIAQDWLPSRLALYYVTRVYMTGDAPDEDTGCYLRDLCKAMSRYQLPPEIYWRYDISKFALPPPFLQADELAPAPLVEYRAVNRDEFSLKSALAERNVVIVGIAVYESFMTPLVASTGVVPMPKPGEQCLGGHGCLLIGFTVSTWVLRNSWGMWGKKGNFTLPVAYLTNPNLCFDAWVINKAIES